MKNNFKEIIKFIINGGVCFLIEFFLMILFTDFFSIYYIISSTIAFIISTIINYIICVLWVFNIDEERSRMQKIAFFATSIVGLGLNQMMMSIGVGIFLINYKIMKIMSSGVVMIVNYIMKKYILTK